MREKRKPTKKTLRASIRASVPDGKLKGARILLADNPQNSSALGGFTEYGTKGKVVKIAAPIGDDAFGITIRGHETAHATKHKPTRRKPKTLNEALAAQHIDDVDVENMRLDEDLPKSMLRMYRRAHLAVAMRDLRGTVNRVRAVQAGKRPDTIADRNGSLLNAVRTLAMLDYYGTGEATETMAKADGIKRLRHALGTKLVSAIWKVIKLARMNGRKRNTAISMLTALLETERPDVDEGDEEMEGDKGDLLMPPIEGDSLDGHMAIHDLRPKNVFTSKEKQISRRYAPNGVIINAVRFVNAIVSGDANGLFARRLREKAGGTLLIDASGSMGASKANLSQLCALVPSATVAYYSGRGKAKGDLNVYAYEGKRYNGELPSETLHGGNDVDLAAIRWLMKQAKPWTLVSDLEFCGGPIGSETVAFALVERASQRGDLTVHRSLDAAYEAFGGKGELKNY